MILHIDLAPPDLTHESNIQDILPFLFMIGLAGGVGFIVPMIIGQSFDSDAADYKAKTQEKKNTLSSLQIDLEKMKVTERQALDIENRQKVIGSISTGRKQPVFLLDKLQQIHLERMWLTSLDFSVSSQEMKPVVTIQGYAKDYNVVSEYLRRIKGISSQQDERIIDTKSFVPTFEEGLKTPSPEESQAIGKAGNSLNLEIEEVVLGKLLTDKIVPAFVSPIQNFTLSFKPSIDMSYLKIESY